MAFGNWHVAGIRNHDVTHACHNYENRLRLLFRSFPSQSDQLLTDLKYQKRGVSFEKLLLIIMFDTDSSSDPHGHRKRSPTQAPIPVLDAVCAQRHK